MKNIFKTVSLDAMLDKHIGKRGSIKRKVFEKKLKEDLLKESPQFNTLNTLP